MTQFNQSFHGLVLSVNPHKEKDALVKILTKEYGKRTFFVRRLKQANHPLSSSLQLGVYSSFLGDINQKGLSFLRDASVKENFSGARFDPNRSAYLTYFLNLVDASDLDGQSSPKTFERLLACLEQLEKGQVGKVLQVALEWQMLETFGLGFSFKRSAVSGLVLNGDDLTFSLSPLGFSFYNELSAGSCLLSKPAARLSWLLGQAPIHRLRKVEVEDILLDEGLKVLGIIYSEYAGLNLKSRRYLKKMDDWLKKDFSVWANRGEKQE
ncbi:DNA repair protein RecO [Atopobacter sp. AH10]|uniref:DNA repair protein RecO n=1 Tax=Atopobacter sp. AH10 TaxID=2315861 RepID=UPI000EF1F16F|nr:DNA repair protein RecO [Atopobacter sp. AH10]RLK62498.1 DNA repair protein RecO [Atopobacter sp. AH10]